jgi:hypothetical protein
MSETLASEIGKRRAEEVKAKLADKSVNCDMREVLEFLVDGMTILVMRQNGNGSKAAPPKRVVAFWRWLRIENYSGVHVAIILLAIAVASLVGRPILELFLK